MRWLRWGYAYVGVELGFPSNAMGFERCRRVHIMIAYASTMEREDMRKLHYELQGIFDRWRSISPERRPSKLIRFRKFKCKKPEELGYDC